MAAVCQTAIYVSVSLYLIFISFISWIFLSVLLLGEGEEGGGGGGGVDVGLNSYVCVFFWLFNIILRVQNGQRSTAICHANRRLNQ